MSLRQPSARMAPHLQAAPILLPVGSGMSFTWGFCLEEAGCRGKPAGRAEPGFRRGYHQDSPGPGRLWEQGHPGADWEASLGNPFPAKTAAAPLLTQEGVCRPFLGHSWCPPRRWQQGFVFPLHWRAVLGAGFFGWPQQSPSARDLPGLSQNHQPGLSWMMSRTEVGCSVPCQSPVTWRDAAWPMPEPAIGLWRPWETSALLLRELCVTWFPHPLWLRLKELISAKKFPL